jgi:SAM-dependent methyltransferase
MSSGCPLCGTSKFSYLHKNLKDNATSAIVKCSNCLHIYTLLLTQPDSDELYNDEVYKVVENRNSLFDKILNWEYSIVVRKINSLKPTKGELLDFGSGKGKFASIAKENGWEVKCVETAKERAEYARKIYGLEVNTEFYISGRIFGHSFNVLTVFHVLEHLPSPQNLLNELISRNLDKDALVVIEVPNIKSLQAYIAGKNWMHLDVPRHLNHFYPAKLRDLVKAAGLNSIKTNYFSFHLGVLGMTDSLLKLFGYRRNIIYELKNKRSIPLKLAILLLLPVALLLESIAAMVGYGGIIRMYLKRGY